MFKSRRNRYLFIFLISMGMIFSVNSSPAHAHELWLEAHQQQGGELRLDIFWGHLRDFIDRANYEQYELYVKHPHGEIEQLPLEGIGVLGRSYFNPREDGEYIFWAERTPSIYSPAENINTLSVQVAKLIYLHGEAETSGSLVETALEIVPETHQQHWHVGDFHGVVFMEGTQAGQVQIHAYGPQDTTVETITQDDGSFTVSLDKPGVWLIKASFVEDEAGEYNGESYDQISRATTLLVHVADAHDNHHGESTKGVNESASIWTQWILFISGGLIGAAITLFFLRKGRR